MNAIVVIHDDLSLIKLYLTRLFVINPIEKKPILFNDIYYNFEFAMFIHELTNQSILELYNNCILIYFQSKKSVFFV